MSKVQVWTELELMDAAWLRGFCRARGFSLADGLRLLVLKEKYSEEEVKREGSANEPATIGGPKRQAVTA